ncbi:M1 family metallopeptidase [Massilia sp. S19_KUP03_FR1]|uniref:M1 family metallopeptidase n=1 Tax=Massilia sp. S19_KUP03_FR1 TaxID=3025503 RepID=UPI002FCDA72B
MQRRLIATAVLALAAACALPVHAAPRPVAPMVTTQLPRSAVPRHYEVVIAPDAVAGTFAGKVTITLDIIAPTDAITLNAADLAFTRATLAAAGGKAQDARTSVDAAAQTASFTFARRLAPGRYKLALDYTGVIGTQAAGLFSLDYATKDGKKRALYTQFENSDARRMIPSWDEPFYKATFALSADVPASDAAVSNMPIVRRTLLSDGRTRVVFAQSPKMSTYLLFFGLGDFERVTKMAEGTELGVVTRRGGTGQAAFVLNESAAILKEYNDYFGVRYPLPKLDNVAAPGRSQFFGAMENWGAIFTFEYAMLLDPAISTQQDRQEAFATVAHEMAHQWFGDLVTMAWWDDLWLNEGFASWMENRMMTRLHPEWNTALNVVSVHDRAMLRDAMVTTHPVVQRIDTVEQASQAFDDITYQKGESVIRMLENYVGETAWRDGVRAYMRKHKYGNTVSDDLWASIEKAAGKPVKGIAHDFTLQPGVPLVRVGAPVCTNGESVVLLTQGEYSRDQPSRKPLTWQVPVVAQTLGSAKQARTVVTKGQATLSVPGCGALVVNAGQNGYYRTLYSPQAFDALSVQFGALAPVDQLGLLSDSWALGLAGLAPIDNLLDLAAGTPERADPQVLAKLTDVFMQIHALYGTDSPRRQRFDNYAIARLAPVLARIGWDADSGEAQTVASLRADLIEALGAFQHAPTLGEAQRRYLALQREPGSVPAALRQPVLAVVARNNDVAGWAALRAAAKAEKTPMVKDQLYMLLASVEDKGLSERALELALTDEPGATNSAAMVRQVAQHAPELAFDFALANIAKMNTRIDESSRSRFFPSLATSSGDPAMVAKVQQYAAANLTEGSRGDAQTAVAEIKDRIKVRQERLPEIDGWLARHAR